MYLNTWGHLALHPHRLRDLHLKKNQYHLVRKGYLPISWEQIQKGLYDLPLSLLTHEMVEWMSLETIARKSGLIIL